ncbi:MAG: hypothetical protein P0S96_04550 [Simkaniaceae bacterium]|nr:hypothetical protein [Candidatus Sacchlamyda saccharinae]
MKRLLLIAFSLLAIWGTARFCHHQTKGFRLSKIAGNTTCLSQTSPPLPKNLESTLQQKFCYFARGNQSFSFVSEDGKYILKFFNNRYQNRLFWLRFTPFKARKTLSRQKLAKTFTSYQIALDHLQKETGLYYLHLAKSCDCPKTTIIDPLGIEHPIDLNNHAFAVQKKATMAYPYFAKCAEEKDFDKAKLGFVSLFALLKKKMELGIGDNDPLIRTNFGFIQDEAVEVDLGPFSYASTTDRHKEITKIALPLRHWLENHHPELLPAFYDALENY